MPPGPEHSKVPERQEVRGPIPSGNQRIPNDRNGMEQSPRAHLQSRSSPTVLPRPSDRSDTEPTLRELPPDTKLVRTAEPAPSGHSHQDLRTRGRRDSRIAVSALR